MSKRDDWSKLQRLDSLEITTKLIESYPIGAF